MPKTWQSIVKYADLQIIKPLQVLSVCVHGHLIFHEAFADKFPAGKTFEEIRGAVVCPQCDEPRVQHCVDLNLVLPADEKKNRRSKRRKSQRNFTYDESGAEDEADNESEYEDDDEESVYSKDDAVADERGEEEMDRHDADVDSEPTLPRFCGSRNEKRAVTRKERKYNKGRVKLWWLSPETFYDGIQNSKYKTYESTWALRWYLANEAEMKARHNEGNTEGYAEHFGQSLTLHKLVQVCLCVFLCLCLHVCMHAIRCVCMCVRVCMCV